MDHVLYKYALRFNQINCAHLDLALRKILTKTTHSISLRNSLLWQESTLKISGDSYIEPISPPGKNQ